MIPKRIHYNFMHRPALHIDMAFSQHVHCSCSVVIIIVIIIFLSLKLSWCVVYHLDLLSERPHKLDKRLVFRVLVDVVVSVFHTLELDNKAMGHSLLVDVSASRLGQVAMGCSEQSGPRGCCFFHL